jgi:hypothetical protein
MDLSALLLPVIPILGLKDFGTGMEVALFYPKMAPRVMFALVCSESSFLTILSFEEVVTSLRGVH